MFKLSFNSTAISVLLLLLYFFGTLIFLSGYFPFSINDRKFANMEELPDNVDGHLLNKTRLYQMNFEHTTLMIIDAFRLNFLQKNSSSYLQYLLNNKKGCLYTIRVQPPTVTMPRIKSIVSGTVPGFLDVVFNLGSSEMKIDSILHQLNIANQKIAFYGDDTWTKMFPNTFYRKQENSDSLFVNDFYEGDKNISDNLMKELKDPDWRLLILHFLGLDHIGHVEGPFSNKIPKKLKEMDDILKHIHSSMLNWRKDLHSPSLLLATGDHGMRDSGGHGGSTFNELHVPLVAIGSNCSSDNNIFDQVDIGPTLAVLLGVPIPASSIGSIIGGLIEHISPEQQLFALYYNNKRLVNNIKTKLQVNQQEFFLQYAEGMEEHKKFIKSMKFYPKGDKSFFKRAKLLYIASSNEIRSVLCNSFVKFDYYGILFGLVITTFTFITSIFHVSTSQKDKYDVILNIKIIVIITVIGIFIREIIRKSTNDEESSLFQFNGKGIILVICLCCLLAGFCTIFLSFRNNLYSLKFKGLTIIGFVKVVVILHGISLASTSFIEEEHQTYYYLLNTFFIILFVMEVTSNEIWHDNFIKYFKIYIKFFFNGNDIYLNHLKSSDYLNRFKSRFFNLVEQVAMWIVLFFCHVTARRLNQTGDKWMMLNDIGDWLNCNKMWNSLFLLMGLLALNYSCCKLNNILTNILTVAATTLIYYYRTTTGSVLLPGVDVIPNSSSTTIFWCIIIEIFGVNYVPIVFNAISTKKLTPSNIKICLRTNITLFCIFSALLHKPHNVMICSILLYTSETIHRSVNQLYDGKIQIILITVSHYWLGRTVFYYQGNSNSLASIDVNAGYVGINHYNAFIVGTFIVINSYSGSILTYLLMWYYQISDTNRIGPFFQTINLMVMLPVTLYLYFSTIFRNHLFIWTVFSPKLMFEIFHLILVTLIVSTTYIIMNSVNKLM